MATEGILIKDLSAKTTIADDDLVVIGEGSDAKKMTVAKFKELIGIDALNTKRTWEKLAEQVTLGVWENHSVNDLSQYKEIAVVVHDTQGSFSAYILATSLFAGTTDQVPFGGRPPQGDGFGLGRYINNTTIALFSRVGTQKTELYGIL